VRMRGGRGWGWDKGVLNEGSGGGVGGGRGG
jgi:hypothetical protein